MSDLSADDLRHIRRILRTIRTNDYLSVAYGRVTIDGSTQCTDEELAALERVLGPKE